MKKYLIVCVSLLGGLLASASHAAVFVGSSSDITDFVNGSEVSTRGTLVDAINLINDSNPISSTTINGVTFKGIAPGQLHEAGESFAEASFVYNYHGFGYQDTNLWTSGGAYDSLADSQLYGTDDFNKQGDDGYGVVNLSPGILYELQIFMLDDRAGVNKSNATMQVTQLAWTGVNNNIDTNVPLSELGYFEGISIGGNGVTEANGEIVTLIFTVDPGYNGITVNTWNDGAFNGMQLRQVTLEGDLDGDNDVDGRDFLLWQRTDGSPEMLESIQTFYGLNLNSPPLAAVNAIPEPSTALLALGALAFLPRRSRNRG